MYTLECNFEMLKELWMLCLDCELRTMTLHLTMLDPGSSMHKLFILYFVFPNEDMLLMMQTFQNSLTAAGAGIALVDSVVMSLSF